MKQSLLASWLETIGNTATGFAISLALQWAVCWWYGLALQWNDNLAIIGAFTVASLLRGLAWRRLMEKLHVRTPLSPAMLAVIAERNRQMAIEGWDIAHDDGHAPGDLARASAAYLISGAGDPRRGLQLWPWNQDWWKPDPLRSRRDYVRGLALGLAEIEKLDRTKKVKRS